MLFVHEDKKYLQSIIGKVGNEVGKVGLSLHPNKIYLQPYYRFFLFLGQYIKPYRSYISNRVKNNFYQALRNVNQLLVKTEIIPWESMCQIQSTLNAYLGTMKHANSHRLIKNACLILVKRFYCFFSFDKNFSKVIINKDFWQWHYLLTYQSTN
jgi:hypothetical protein